MSAAAPSSAIHATAALSYLASALQAQYADSPRVSAPVSDRSDVGTTFFATPGRPAATARPDVSFAHAYPAHAAYSEEDDEFDAGSAAYGPEPTAAAASPFSFYNSRHAPAPAPTVVGPAASASAALSASFLPAALPERGSQPRVDVSLGPAGVVSVLVTPAASAEAAPAALAGEGDYDYDDGDGASSGLAASHAYGGPAPAAAASAPALVSVEGYQYGDSVYYQPAQPSQTQATSAHGHRGGSNSVDDYNDYGNVGPTAADAAIASARSLHPPIAASAGHAANATNAVSNAELSKANISVVYRDSDWGVDLESSRVHEQAQLPTQPLHQHQTGGSSANKRGYESTDAALAAAAQGMRSLHYLLRAMPGATPDVSTAHIAHPQPGPLPTTPHRTSHNNLNNVSSSSSGLNTTAAVRVDSAGFSRGFTEGYDLVRRAAAGHPAAAAVHGHSVARGPMHVNPLLHGPALPRTPAPTHIQALAAVEAANASANNSSALNKSHGGAGRGASAAYSDNPITAALAAVYAGDSSTAHSAAQSAASAADVTRLRAAIAALPPSTLPKQDYRSNDASNGSSSSRYSASLSASAVKSKRAPPRTPGVSVSASASSSSSAGAGAGADVELGVGGQKSPGRAAAAALDVLARFNALARAVAPVAATTELSNNNINRAVAYDDGDDIIVSAPVSSQSYYSNPSTYGNYHSVAGHNAAAVALGPRVNAVTGAVTGTAVTAATPYGGNGNAYRNIYSGYGSNTLLGAGRGDGAKGAANTVNMILSPAESMRERWAHAKAAAAAQPAVHQHYHYTDAAPAAAPSAVNLTQQLKQTPAVMQQSNSAFQTQYTPLVPQSAQFAAQLTDANASYSHAPAVPTASSHPAAVATAAHGHSAYSHSAHSQAPAFAPAPAVAQSVPASAAAAAPVFAVDWSHPVHRPDSLPAWLAWHAASGPHATAAAAAAHTAPAPVSATVRSVAAPVLLAPPPPPVASGISGDVLTRVALPLLSPALAAARHMPPFTAAPAHATEAAAALRRQQQHVQQQPLQRHLPPAPVPAYAGPAVSASVYAAAYAAATAATAAAATGASGIGPHMSSSLSSSSSSVRPALPGLASTHGRAPTPVNNNNANVHTNTGMSLNASYTAGGVDPAVAAAAKAAAAAHMPARSSAHATNAFGGGDGHNTSIGNATAAAVAAVRASVARSAATTGCGGDGCGYESAGPVLLLRPATLISASSPPRSLFSGAQSPPLSRAQSPPLSPVRASPPAHSQAQQTQPPSQS